MEVERCIVRIERHDRRTCQLPMPHLSASLATATLTAAATVIITIGESHPAELAADTQRDMVRRPLGGTPKESKVGLGRA